MGWTGCGSLGVMHSWIAALALAALTATSSAFAVSSSSPPPPPFCRPGFAMTLPTARITLERGQTFGDLDQYGVPHPIRHTVVAGWRLEHDDVAGAVELGEELLAIAQVVTEKTGSTSRRVLYFPYRFDWTSRLGDLDAPWFSGMAQARITGLFARLYEVTGEYRWKRAAIETYRSLTRADAVRRVWHTSSTGYRWVDTFSWASRNPILNGHLYAIAGLHDFWRVTGQGEDVLRSLVRTVGLQGHRFMDPAGHHQYDLRRSGPASVYYHEVVYELMQEVGRFAPCLASAARRFYDPLAS